MTIRTLFSVASNVKNGGFACGIECELEALLDYTKMNPYEWQAESDGSLRNNGVEFITKKPAGREQIVKQFKELHSALEFTNANDATSERTSTHVHVNCLELEPEQVRSIILHYALFEPIFFHLVTAERANNIHCVALNQTNLPEFYRRGVPDLVSKWSKYTALNVLPLSEIGTIEFRHLQGTRDPEVLNMWLTVLEQLWTYAKDHHLYTEVLKDNGKIVEIFREIFKGTPAMKYEMGLFSLITDSLIDVKLAFH